MISSAQLSSTRAVSWDEDRRKKGSDSTKSFKGWIVSLIRFFSVFFCELCGFGVGFALLLEWMVIMDC